MTQSDNLRNQLAERQAEIAILKKELQHSNARAGSWKKNAQDARAERDLLLMAAKECQPMINSYLGEDHPISVNLAEACSVKSGF